MRSLLISALSACCFVGCASTEGPPFAHDIAIPRMYATGSDSPDGESQAAWFIRGHEEGWWSKVQSFVSGAPPGKPALLAEWKDGDYVSTGYLAGYSIGYDAASDRITLLIAKHGEAETQKIARESLDKADQIKRQAEPGATDNSDDAQ